MKHRSLWSATDPNPHWHPLHSFRCVHFFFLISFILLYYIFACSEWNAGLLFTVQYTLYTTYFKNSKWNRRDHVWDNAQSFTNFCEINHDMMNKNAKSLNSINGHYAEIIEHWIQLTNQNQLFLHYCNMTWSHHMMWGPSSHNLGKKYNLRF